MIKPKGEPVDRSGVTPIPTPTPKPHVRYLMLIVRSVMKICFPEVYREFPAAFLRFWARAGDSVNSTLARSHFSFNAFESSGARSRNISAIILARKCTGRLISPLGASSCRPCCHCSSGGCRFDDSKQWLMFRTKKPSAEHATREDLIAIEARCSNWRPFPTIVAEFQQFPCN